MVSEAVIPSIGKDRAMYPEKGQEKTFGADMIIISEGWKKNMVFVPLTDKMGDKITVIGDARRPGRISNAVKVLPVS